MNALPKTHIVMKCGFTRAVIRLALPLLALGTGALAQASSSTSSDPQAPFTSRCNQVPALWQKDPRCEFAGHGNGACGMTATINNLMWLAVSGYPNLLADPAAPLSTREERVAALIQLAKAFTVRPYAFIGTTGSTPGYLKRSLDRYIKDHGYEVDELDSRGVTAMGEKPAPVTTNATDDPTLEGDDAAEAKPGARENGEDEDAVPFSETTAGLPAAEPKKAPKTHPTFTMAFLKSELRAGAAVHLAIGRYSLLPNVPDTYKRTSGHFLTLVGFGVNKNGEPDPYTLIVHDPGKKPNSGPTWPNSFWRFVPATHGHRVANGPNEPKQGDSLVDHAYVIEGKGGKRITILENATILRLKPATVK